MTNHLFNARAHLTPNTGSSRRDFLKQSASATAAIASGLSISLPAFSEPLSKNSLAKNPIGFNGERQDLITKKYHFGNGVRMYNPSLMRFHASDSMSPFGKGGINSYAYALGDPVNHRDPSGHIAISAMIIGITIGAVIGASIAVLAEGIKVAVTGEKFDWKPVVIGAALGGIGGGFGAAASGLSLGVKAGLALGEAVFSGLVDFGLNVAAGMPVKDAGINAGIGALIGLGTFGTTSLIRLRAYPQTSLVNYNHFAYDVFTFDDIYKGKPRLTIVGHSAIVDEKVLLASRPNMTPEMVARRLNRMFNMNDYDSIRTIVCFSGRSSKQAPAFGQKLSSLLKKPVKSYKRRVYSFNTETYFEADKMIKRGMLIKDVRYYFSSKKLILAKQNPYSIFNEFKEFREFVYNPVHFKP